ncbi:DUF4157 domain-containing protein [Leptolyngbya cf. ectocarpi LEGE 11479]|uniref:DUF4157 domain-containing protein n=1 Tax=Leptolyngbya cf. ectocarpi LEGE 11479 TaxID=1828722 RepID=A0A928X297_LEPEC|nr:DUF4157 domain-containing protein [Leptolyngbya ectocarpi]MBE9066456.1 DUF4157 domain-containing protein [Leptolyngbya cf. ectocarpi LEGE 11479]
MRTFFEPRFGLTFDHVRVHTNRQASQLARAFQAKAFTLGNNIVFRTGEYQPGSYQGKQLLAHELTHVIQQRGVNQNTAPRTIQRQSAPSLPSLPDPDLECNLDLIALSRILAGDRTAALKVISCCIQTPIGRGCTKDLVDAACALFPDLCGQRNTPGGTNRCPPGFRPARTTTFRGQCCRSGAVIESERDCCPSVQITVNNPLFPSCCPPSQMPDGPKRNCIDKTQMPLPIPPVIIPRPQPPRGQPRPQPAAPQISSEVIFFFFDSTIRRPESNDGFERVLSLLTTIPRLRVHIIGHASLEGTEQYNLDLGQRRADAVRNELALLGEIDRSRITTSSLGEALPAVPEPSGRSFSPNVEAIRGQNRRVELFFTDPEGEFAPSVPRFQLRQPELRLPGSSGGGPKLQL